MDIIFQQLLCKKKTIKDGALIQSIIYKQSPFIKEQSTYGLVSGQYKSQNSCLLSQNHKYAKSDQSIIKFCLRVSEKLHTYMTNGVMQVSCQSKNNGFSWK